MISTAKKFIAAWKREHAARDERKALALKLDPRIREEGSIVVGSLQVILEQSSRRTPTKAELVATFGEAGEKFWDALAPVTYSYLTVAPVKVKKAG